MTLAEIAATLFSGGAAGYMARAARDAYVARLRNDEAHATLDATGERHEQDIVHDLALRDREERQRMGEEVRALRTQVTDLSVAVARCDAERAAERAAHEREMAELRERVRTLEKMLMERGSKPPPPMEAP